ncbi:MAG: hypothetical protein EXQ71_06170 [Acidimicrobiia bacterium]|nr:hypothetical protein [Acidimicrobiia bacterium]
MIRGGRLLMLAVLLATGCGVSADGQPQAIEPTNLPPGLLDPNPTSSTTLPQSLSTTTVFVYFLERQGDTSVLVSVPREVRTSEATLPGARIAPLLAAPTLEEQQGGLTSAIPRATKLLRAPAPAGSDDLLIDLSSEFFDAQGQDLANAFGQIVWTVTEIPGITGVRFLRDALVINAVDDQGVEQQGAVTKANYRSLAQG